MNQPKLSIIVPIYNVEAYLRKCVNSLLCQDYEDYEIILVDDGSTDNSGIIADELSGGESLEDASLQVRGENRIRVIHQENRGLSGARNTGIMAARGEYVCFVDSDDYWEPNVLGGLMAQVEREDLDVLRFDYQNVRLKDGAYEVFEPNKEPHKHDIRTDVVDGITYLNERMGYACYAVMYVVRKRLLVFNENENKNENEDENEDENENTARCLFTEGIHFEDVDWLPRLMLKAERVNASQTVVYNYLMREGSITKVGANVEKKRRNVEDCMGIVERLGELLRQYPTCTWLRRMQSSMAVGIVHSVVTSFPAERRVYVRRLKAIHAYPFVIANQGKTYTKRARIMNFSTALYSLLIKLRSIRQ